MEGSDPDHLHHLHHTSTHSSRNSSRSSSLSTSATSSPSESPVATSSTSKSTTRRSITSETSSLSTSSTAAPATSLAPTARTTGSARSSGLGNIHLDLLPAHSLAVQGVPGILRLLLGLVGDEGISFTTVVRIKNLSKLLKLRLQLLL